MNKQTDDRFTLASTYWLGSENKRDRTHTTVRRYLIRDPITRQTPGTSRMKPVCLIRIYIPRQPAIQLTSEPATLPAVDTKRLLMPMRLIKIQSQLQYDQPKPRVV